jgi:hypothetical protein
MRGGASSYLRPIQSYMAQLDQSRVLTVLAVECVVEPPSGQLKVPLIDRQRTHIHARVAGIAPDDNAGNGDLQSGLTLSSTVFRTYLLLPSDAEFMHGPDQQRSARNSEQENPDWQDLALGSDRSSNHVRNH